MTDSPAENHLDVHKITWTALLAQWVAFARSAVALPDDPQGRRIKACVPDLIMLQALWFALQHVDELSPDQRALGFDRAAVLIDRHVQQLTDRWHPAPLPQRIEQLITDAQQLLAKVSGAQNDQ
ncbi:MAG: hypothetical protein JKX85_11405 [Phycisphaeraceae bacterium]|nr:hypothetical protein [Phycisphaeraceae bacterium]